MDDDRPSHVYGYTDTPVLPDSEYRVHDPERPEPPAVDPGGPVTKAPPSDATVLFDGADLSAWEAPDGGPPEWVLEDGYMEAPTDSGGIRTTAEFGSCQLHLEWATPSEVDGRGMHRGNSGVFLMDRYEIQILDSYENPAYADGYAAAIYGQSPPLVNASRPPGEWQSFDIVWDAPTFDDDDLAEPARLTLFHNGVVVQNATELIGPTTHADIEAYTPHPPEAPLLLQDHGDPVRFRNIWYRPLRS